MEYEFQITDLSLNYPDSNVRVLSNLKLDIRKGVFYVLLGQNGSGKSSLIKCLSGLQNWTNGEILRNGVSRRLDSSNFNKDLLLVSEDIILPQIRINKLAKIYKEIWGGFDNAKFIKILSYARIDQTKYPVQISRGQRALLQVALALAVNADTLLIDEVTAVLDPYVRSRVVAELENHHRNKKATVIVATNISTEFRSTNAEIILLDEGRIYLQGSIQELRKEFVKVKSDGIPSVAFVETPSLGEQQWIGRSSEKVEDKVISDEEITLEEIFIYLSARRRA